MIIQLYILRQILQGTLFTLLALVSLNLLFLFLAELEDLGKGHYNLLVLIEYLVLLAPGRAIDLMPLVVILGTTLSLGVLANHSEIIAMQAAGVSTFKLLGIVLQAALIIAACVFLMANWVVPLSETNAHRIKSFALNKVTTPGSQRDVWIKDGRHILQIGTVMPNAVFHDMEIYTVDENANLLSIIAAESAIPDGDHWRLIQVRETRFTEDGVSSRQLEEFIYAGGIADYLSNTRIIEPQYMSSRDLYDHVSFLQKNGLDASVEGLVFWQKMYQSLTIIILCIFAVPFVMGSQRQGNSGKRLMICIVLGLSYVVANQVLPQLANQLKLLPMLSALIPVLMLFILTAFIFWRQKSKLA